MDEVTLANKSYQLVCKDLGLEEEMNFEGFDNAFDRLEEHLATQVAYLLNHDFNRLLNSLYRIDVPEHQVQNILHQSRPDNISLELARAIIGREKQKVITRLMYSSS